MTKTHEIPEATAYIAGHRAGCVEAFASAIRIIREVWPQAAADIEAESIRRYGERMREELRRR